MRRGAAALLAALLFASACAAPDAESAAPPPTLEDGWRGDVSYPGLPAIGVRYVVHGAEPRLIAAPNMGFGSAPLVGFRMNDDGASFAGI